MGKRRFDDYRKQQLDDMRASAPNPFKRQPRTKNDAGSLIRKDLEPMLYELYRKSFPSFWSSPSVGSGGFNAQAMMEPEELVGDCLNCGMQDHSDYDPYYCDTCRPRRA